MIGGSLIILILSSQGEGEGQFQLGKDTVRKDFKKAFVELNLGQRFEESQSVIFFLRGCKLSQTSLKCVSLSEILTLITHLPLKGDQTCSLRDADLYIIF